MTVRAPIFLWAILILMITLHVVVWADVRHTRARWTNVPPVPSVAGVSAGALGDRQFAYRLTGLTLQNLGSVGGKVQPLKNYDYERLKDWLFIALKLDSRSNFVPYLAAYYFGAVQDSPDKARLMAEFLQIAGHGQEKQKWRWLAQAVYIARFQAKDYDLAYSLAQELAAIPDPDLPYWAKQMPAFIMAARGDKRDAYDFLVEMLKTDARTLPINEVNAMRAYICRETLTVQEAQSDPLCEGLK